MERCNREVAVLILDVFHTINSPVSKAEVVLVSFVFYSVQTRSNATQKYIFFPQKNNKGKNTERMKHTGEVKKRQTRS